MSAAQPLLAAEAGEVSPSCKNAHLSLGMIIKIKSHVHHWKVTAHQHAMDRSMAMGYRCHRAAKLQVDDHHSEESEKNIDLQTNTEAVTNLLNNCLGAGILAVPLGISKVGMVTALVMLIASAALNRFSLMLLIDSCGLANIQLSYCGIANHTLGKTGHALVTFTFTSMGFLCLVSYVDATTDAIDGILGFFGIALSKWMLFAVAVVLNFPPTFIRSLKSVALLSGVAFVGAIVVVICTMIECGGGLIRDGMPPSDSILLVSEDYLTVLGEVNIFAVTFCIQAGGSIVMSTLQDDSRSNKAKVTGAGFGIALLVNASVGFLAYLRFTNTITGDVVNAFDPTSVVTLFCKIALLDLVVLSYMFMMIPCRTALLCQIFNKNEAKMEASATQFNGMTLAINFSAVALAWFVPNVSTVISINGAVSANLLAWILPAAIYIAMRSSLAKDHKDYKPKFSPANLPFFCMIIFGIFCAVTGIMKLAGLM